VAFVGRTKKKRKRTQMQINQPKGVKPKTIERKLKIVVNWQCALKQKGVK
jgi:excinuclease UvrABC helicase subunit UvrB